MITKENVCLHSESDMAKKIRDIVSDALDQAGYDILIPCNGNVFVTDPQSGKYVCLHIEDRP